MNLSDVQYAHWAKDLTELQLPSEVVGYAVEECRKSEPRAPSLATFLLYLKPFAETHAGILRRDAVMKMKKDNPPATDEDVKAAIAKFRSLMDQKQMPGTQKQPTPEPPDGQSRAAGERDET